MSESPVESRWHSLDDGVRLEVLFLPAVPPLPTPPRGRTKAEAPRPPLLFLHGAFHGAWCWREHFLPYFAAAGHDCYALSLRAHGGSEAGSGPHPGGAVGTLRSHAEDVASFVATLPQPPVLVVHSFTGLVAIKYLSLAAGPSQAGAGAGSPTAAVLGRPGGQAQGGWRGWPSLAGMVFLGAMPPSGQGGLLWRGLTRAPLQFFKIGWHFARKAYRTSPAACRFLFFSEGLAEEELARYMVQMAAAGHLRLTDGHATPDNSVPRAPPPAGWPEMPAARVFVGRGSLDLLVDWEAAAETAAYFGAGPPVVWEGVGHDCMLDARWGDVAASLALWLCTLPPSLPCS